MRSFLVFLLDGVEAGQFVLFPLLLADFTVSFAQFARSMTLIIDIVAFKHVSTCVSVGAFTLLHPIVPLTLISEINKGKWMLRYLSLNS